MCCSPSCRSSRRPCLHHCPQEAGSQEVPLPKPNNNMFTTNNSYPNLVFPSCDVMMSDGSSCDTASMSTRSSSTRSSNCSSESPEDAVMAEEQAADYNDSLWNQPQHHVPSIVQQPLLHRPQPRKLTPSTRLPSLKEPIQVDVPFLVNYDDILMYGPQKLPTVLEVEDEDFDDGYTSSEEEDPMSDATTEDDELDSYCYLSQEPFSNNYIYVESYPDHRWDLARGDEVLSEAIYYHVLEAAPTMAPPPHQPLEASPVLGLVKPQALRVVCPLSTTIAPVVRPYEDQEEGDGQPKDCYLDWYRSYLEGPEEARAAGASPSQPWLC